MMESPFLPVGGETFFRCQVVTTGPVRNDNTTPTRRISSPCRRRRAWEDSPTEMSPASKLAVNNTRNADRINWDLPPPMITPVTEATAPPTPPPPPTPKTSTTQIIIHTPKGESTSNATVLSTDAIKCDKSSVDEDESNDDDEMDSSTPAPSHPEIRPDNDDSSPVLPRKLERVLSISVPDDGGINSIRILVSDNLFLFVVIVGTALLAAFAMDWMLVVPQEPHDHLHGQMEVAPHLSTVVSTDVPRLLPPSHDTENTVEDAEPADWKNSLQVFFENIPLEDELESNAAESNTATIIDLGESTSLVVPVITSSNSVVVLLANVSLETNTSLVFQKHHDTSDAVHNKQQKDSLVETVVALSHDGDIMVVASSSTHQQREGDTETLNGWVRVYSRTQQSQIGKDVSLGTVSLEDLGVSGNCPLSLSSSGTCFVTGWSGTIRLFFYDSAGVWMEDANVQSLFRNHLTPGVVPSSVTISTDCNTIVVAADAVYVATKVGTRWSVDLIQSVSTGPSITSYVRVSLSSDTDASRLAIAHLSVDAEGVAIGGGVGVHVLNLDAKSKEWLRLGQPLSSHNETWQAGDLMSMSSDGTTVAVGQPMDTDNRGQILVFSYNPTNNEWTQMGGALVGGAGSSFGVALSLSSDGQCLAIRDKYGLFTTYAFDPVAVVWNPFGESFYSAFIPNVDVQDRNGYAAYPKVAISGDCNWVAIGDPSPQKDLGLAHMFPL